MHRGTDKQTVVYSYNWISLSRRWKWTTGRLMNNLNSTESWHKRGCRLWVKLYEVLELELIYSGAGVDTCWEGGHVCFRELFGDDTHLGCIYFWNLQKCTLKSFAVLCKCICKFYLTILLKNKNYYKNHKLWMLVTVPMPKYLGEWWWCLQLT